MAESKKYISERSNFTIHRAPYFVQQLHGGDVVNVREQPPPIEFTNGTYETDDPEEQDAIKTCPAYGEDLTEGDVAPHPSERDLEAAVEKAPDSGPSLQDQLEAADTREEVQQILDAHGLPGLPEGTTPDATDPESVRDDEAEEEPGDAESRKPSGESDLTPIEGVSKKAEALKALESTDLDVEVSKRDNVDDIVAFANQNGYRFVDWP